MSGNHTVRYCHTCGARLARDNRLSQCALCQKKAGDLLLGPPDLPVGFWATTMMADAFASWHIGQVIRAYRHHPFHGPRPLSQELVAGWLGLTQTQLSRLENGLPVKDLDKLIAWASVLRMPPRSLWFKLPGEPTRDIALVALDETADAFMMAASESSADALLRAGHLGRNAVDELAIQITSVARRYNSQSRASAFLEARAVRDLGITLINATKRPSELTDLYVIVGEANALLASLAFDLGRWDAAEVLARAATAYADAAGHSSLRAWALGLEATLAFWRGDGDRAIEQVNAGLTTSPPGVPRVRLLHIAARAEAVRRNHAGTAAALSAALAERDLAGNHADELNDDIAGEFRFDDARAAACAGTAWLQLGDGGQAVRCTRRSLDLHGHDPTSVSAGIVSGAHIDSAAARLLEGSLDEVDEHLEAALSAASGDARNVSLSGRLTRVRQLLAAPAWRKEASAIRLTEQVDAWLHGTHGVTG